MMKQSIYTRRKKFHKNEEEIPKGKSDRKEKKRSSTSITAVAQDLLEMINDRHSNVNESNQRIVLD